MNVQRKNLPVYTVQVIDGQAIPVTRGENHTSSTALAFVNEASYEEFKASLKGKTSEKRMEIVNKYNFYNLHHLAIEADKELEFIGNNAQSEGEFRQAYDAYVKKYQGKLIKNYIDETDLNLYVPDEDNDDSFIANSEGIFVVGGEIRNVELNPVLSERTISISNLNNPNTLSIEDSHINSYTVSPASGKKVNFSISRKYDYIRVYMEVRKKMWYGWKNDPHRDLIFEPHFKDGSIKRWIQPFYTRFWKHNQDKIEVDLLELNGGNLGGIIYTWTDYTAELDANGDVIVEAVGNVMAPKCLIEKSENVTVRL